MKIVLPGINKVFETTDDRVYTLIIENQQLLVDILNDFNKQFHGDEGKIVLSENDKLLQTDKNCELLTQFIPFDISTKVLVSKLVSSMEKRGASGDFFENSQALLSYLEKFLYDISFEMTGDIVFGKLNLSSIIKAVGVGFAEDYDSLAEKIVDYMELVREYDRDKLFITLNLRDYISDSDMNAFVNTVLDHNIKIFMIESRERCVLERESRFIVDEDWCEIC